MTTLLQLGVLFRSLGKVEGRKKLQKIVHILQEFGVPFGVKFGYHHYGPFSDELQDLLHSLRHDGLISEKQVNGQYPTFEFTPEQKLVDLLENLKIAESSIWIGFAKELNSKTPRELEALSTLIYLEKSQDLGNSGKSVDEQFKELKPALTELLDGAHTRLGKYKEQFTEELLAS
jgi:uncharacterized protein YwgA